MSTEPKSIAPLDPTEIQDERLEHLDDEAFLHDFLRPTTWPIRDLPKSAWTGHIPFLFGAVRLIRPRRIVELGTHLGTSFFAACQAIERTETASELFAVDTWQGDEHAGEYGEEVFASVQGTIQQRSYDSATLLRTTFDDAAERFSPGSIDLLHIDGLHTYEAVRHDFATWADKVSPGGLVLFHDINVHAKDFGVWRLWDELTKTHRHASFQHSHGLGILQLPGDGFPDLTRLLRLLEDEPRSHYVQSALIAAAEGSEALFKMSIIGPRYEASRTELADLRNEISKLREANQQQRAEADRLALQVKRSTEQFDKANKTVVSQQRRVASLKRQLEDRQRDANAEHDELRSTLKARKRVVQELTTRAKNAEARLEDFQTRSNEAHANTIVRLNEREVQLARQSSAAAQLEADVNSTRNAIEIFRNRKSAKLVAKVGLRIDDPSIAGMPVADEHFRRWSVDTIVSSGLVDEEFYLAAHPDVAEYADGPTLHFARRGQFENRRPNEYFDPTAYEIENQGVVESHLTASLHYALFGAFEFRHTNEGFDSEYYLLRYQDVLNAARNPLGHYVQYGRAEGRQPVRPEQGLRLTRKHLDFDSADERQTIRTLTKEYLANAQQIDDVLVSVVMPTYNRASMLEAAISSVQAQTHTRWELLVLDDGSTDDTLAVVDPFLKDERIRLIQLDHGGVSAARNRGLDEAQGEFIAFLDSDNEWVECFLQLMLTSFSSSDATIGYSAMSVHDDTGTTQYYRGTPFDWDACAESNFVDMNVLMHRRNSDAASPRFETRLKRMVDWDYILRLTREAEVDYVPFVGCRYYDGVDQADRISRAEPLVFGAIVRARTQPGSAEPASFEEVAAALKFDIAIRIGAPWAKREVWGDFHYAEALQAEFERLGHNVRLVFHDDEPLDGPKDEINLVIRGLTPHEPIPGNFNILWIISHPDAVTNEEMAGFNLTYVASDSHAALLQHDASVSAMPLLQATAFSTDPPDGGVSAPVLFVGNSRGVRRPIVEWASDASLDLALYGGGWESTDFAKFVRAKSYPNRRLPSLYANADVVLNDHWPAMQSFGYLSNRLFDVIGAGGRVISDHVPSIEAVFGEAVTEVSSAAELLDAVAHPPSADEQSRATDFVREFHTLAGRARQILRDVHDYLNLPVTPDLIDPLPPQITAGTQEVLNVGLLTTGTSTRFTSSAYIRFVAPLTSEGLHRRVVLHAATDPDELSWDDIDVVIVQRTPIADLVDAHHLVDRAKATNTAIVTDMDDALHRLPDSHPEAEFFRRRIDALEYIVENAAVTLFSTEALADSFGVLNKANTHIVPNGLDPRLWRRFRAAEHVKNDIPQLLYTGTATHDADFDIVLRALDELYLDHRFDLTLIGAVKNPPNRPWLKSTPVPASSSMYLRFPRWLLDQGHFDIALSPLEDTPFNRAKSDIKFLDYCALGAIPVLSDLDPYNGDARQRGFALHAKNTTADWFEKLTKAVGSIQTNDPTSRLDYLWGERSSDQTGLQLLTILSEAVAAAR